MVYEVNFMSNITANLEPDWSSKPEMKLLINATKAMAIDQNETLPTLVYFGKSPKHIVGSIVVLHGTSKSDRRPDKTS